MSVHSIEDARKVTTHRLLEMKQRGEKISMLTAYDYTMASIVDEAGVDVILVGDSASNVVAGNVTTLPISLDQMIYHGKSVVKAVKRALVVVDMPFGSYQISDVEAVKNAIQMMKITHADALKLEGGVEIIEYGTYNVRAKSELEAEKLIADAKALEEAGCFAIVLEKIPAQLAKKVAEIVSIPIIGIGAGKYTDGQVLVLHDMLGMTKGFSPRFLRRYCDLNMIINEAVSHYVSDVKHCDFPNDSEQY